MNICHRAKTLLHFEEELGKYVWNGRQIPLEKWESIASDLGFKPDNYYTSAGKMFAEKLCGNSNDGRLNGTIAGIIGISTR